jgi:DNA-binding transcriptional ArsR family regulator
VLDALGDGTRRKILTCLKAGPASVGELAKQLPVSRPAISQHLGVLRRSDLVTFTTHGTRNVYRLDPDGLESLRSWLDDFWSEVLSSFAAHVAEHQATKTAAFKTKGQPHA